MERENVCIFASESPSDEILPRPSQPKKLAIFLKAMSKQKVIVYVDGFNFYYGLKKNPNEDKAHRQSMLFDANKENPTFHLIMGKYLKKKIVCKRCGFKD